MQNDPGINPVNGGKSNEDTSLLEQTKQQTQHIVQKTQEIAGQAVDQARDQVKSQLASQKDRAAEGLESVAQALRHTGEHMRTEQQPGIGGFADSAARMVEEVTGYFRTRDVDQLMAELENFGRRRPELFLAGAFALGFLATRFFRSSSPSESWRYHGNGMGAGNWATTGHTLPTAYERASSETALPGLTDRGESTDTPQNTGTTPEWLKGVRPE